MLRLFNTLSRKVEEFKPIKDKSVGLYTCGFTVYDYAHIGHIKKYVGDDVLRRWLELSGYSVKHIQNVTDVGHLTSDEDSGDDKLDKRAKERGQTVWEVAKFYTDYFYNVMDEVGNLRPHVVAPATEHISEQLKLIEKLEEKDFVYITDQAIYFDISKFPTYGQLTGQKLEEKEVGVREDVNVDPQKKNPHDFAVWFFTTGHFKDHVMRWPSKYGEGFPGWHIECSAISMEYLGDTIDIHTGGIDHISVHHTNEIAQSEAATGEKFVNYWMHYNFLIVDGVKMSKSLKNFYTLEDIKEKGFDPLSMRYLVLTAHYRDQINFTWDSLTAAQNALNKLRAEVRDWEKDGEVLQEYWSNFAEALDNDLNTPQALAVMWEVIKSELPTPEKAATLLEMDKVLGLGLSDYIGKKVEVPSEVMKLVEQREQARKSGDFAKSDEIRGQISDLGFILEDTPEGPKVR